MTAEPSCDAVTYTEQAQKLKFREQVLYDCGVDSSIIWIRPPGVKKKVRTASRKGKSEVSIWSSVYTTWLWDAASKWDLEHA